MSEVLAGAHMMTTQQSFDIRYSDTTIFTITYSRTNIQKPNDDP